MNEQRTPIPDDMRDFEPSPDWLGADSTELLEANDALARARNQAINLLTSIEEIMLHQNPQIAAEWQVTVGVWETRLLEAQIAARKAKRRFGLAQAYVNIEEPVDTQAIEEQLDKEFEEWQLQLEESTAKYQQAVESQITAIKIGPTASAELKRVFRVLAKRLHPDLHPTLDESARHMFTLAELAYRKGDLKILNSLEVSTRGLDVEPGFSATVIEAQAELTLIEAQIEDLEKRMDQIKAEKPYSLRKLLQDKEWVDTHISQIKREIAEYEDIEHTYQSRYKELMSAHE